MNLPSGTYTVLPCAAPAFTAAWIACVASVAPVGSAPKSVTTLSEPAGWAIGAATCSKSPRSIVKLGDAAVDDTWRRTFVPTGRVEENIVRTSS